MRQTKCLSIKHSLALLSLAALFWMGSPAVAQTRQTQDRDTTARQLSSFDDFMDGHPVVAEQLRKDPSLIRNEEFVENHPALQQYLQQHPGVREEISENPNAFMRQEQRLDTQETRKELTNLDRFMDSHPEIAEQLRKNPSLVNNKEFVDKHPALQQFLQSHSALAQELSQNPNAFMQQKQQFDQQQEGRDREMTRGQLGSMDRFLDSHPEIAEQLRKDPSLVNDKEFVHKHPALQSYLQQHPGVRAELAENPNAFMRQEQRFDRQEQRFNQQQDGRDRDVTRDRDTTRGPLASMDRFLDSHPEIAEQLRKNPSLVNDKEFVQKHPALQSYLQQHPGVRDEFTENPNAFMRQEQRFDRQEDLGRNNPGFQGDNERREMANFGQFLGSHENIAQQISKDPSLLNNKEYMESHPELQEYLKAHPGVQEEATANPQAFIQSMAQVKPAPKAAPLQKPPQKQQ